MVSLSPSEVLLYIQMQLSKYVASHAHSLSRIKMHLARSEMSKHDVGKMTRSDEYANSKPLNYTTVKVYLINMTKSTVFYSYTEKCLKDDQDARKKDKRFIN